jgi:hypothetical protein
VFSLTYRQTACILERQWARKVWEIETDVITNPMTSFGGDSAPNSGTIDATTDEGMAQLEQMGLPVTRTQH